MNRGGVYGSEMDEPLELDDATVDAFVRGDGRDIDPRLANLVDDLRLAYSSTPPAIGPEVAALMQHSVVPAPAPERRRRHRRAWFLGKLGAAMAAAAAATGGLAVAGALPAPVQNVMSHIGVGPPASHHGRGNGHHKPANDVRGGATSTKSTTSQPGATAGNGATESSGTSGASTNTHANVPAVAADHSRACDHQPSASHAQPCLTSTTLPGASTTLAPSDTPGEPATPATNPNAHGLNPNASPNANEKTNNGNHGTTPSSVPVSPPTTPSHGGNKTTPHTNNGHNGNVPPDNPHKAGNP